MPHGAEGTPGAFAWDDMIEASIAGKIDTTVADSTYGREFQPEAYGALGDGTTDDTTAIQSALTAARSVKGSVRFGTGKTYIVSGALDPTGCHVLGHQATLKIKSGTTPAYSVLTSTAGCIIEGLTIDLNKAGTIGVTTTRGFYMSAASWTGLVLRDVTVLNGTVGIEVASTGGGASGGATTYCPTLLDNCRVIACDVANFIVRSLRGATVRDCKSEDGGGLGFYMVLVGDSHVTGLLSTNNTEDGMSCEYCENVTIEGGTFDNNTRTGISIGGGSTTLQENRHVTLTGNVCRNNGALGITIDPTKAGAPSTWVSVWVTLSGNTCQGNTSNGISLENAAHVSATGNICHANGGDGLRVVGAYINTSGNVLTSNTGYGLAVYGVTGHDNGHHRFGSNTSVGNTAGQFAAAGGIADGSLTDIASYVPGNWRASGATSGGADTVNETYIGPAGPTGQAGIDIYGEKIYRSSASVLRTPGYLAADASLLAGYSGTGGYSVGHLQIGGYHLWVDTSGRLRVKSSGPTSDTDGTVVGTQT